ncbi:predicted protein [Sclerotinia sclerotiorum 1980 UF-70]|uniref:Uncharacterized protein n=1 Tax=Sclerotinia sclerotiorum (strain ATCC 18683 / 1980 / Ss-1) TaxID=665079 RepID=A7EWD9_SCLS1|nr:predicted protein [Sclerotinia sclerotiorum 1980 UF-70]EDN93781.1 predicted protein [Sclerotinia sclerotiorum 1980 UF-70]
MHHLSRTQHFVNAALVEACLEGRDFSGVEKMNLCSNSDMEILEGSGPWLMIRIRL